MMERANQDLRQLAEKKGVHLWEVASIYGLNDGNFSRKLRFELKPDEKKRIREIIDQIAENRK